MTVRENIEEIRAEIEKAKTRAGRTDDVLLLAVTKNVDFPLIDESLECGIKEIAENRVQELQKKMAHYEDRVIYHLIGTLQTNKVKDVIGKVKLIHSLDRINLAKEINKRAEQQGIVQDVLVQVNASKEETKSGLYLEDLDEFVYNILEFKYMRIRGLMTMAPYVEDEALIRKVFKDVYDAAEKLKSKYELSMDYLSMGMTHDYKLAVEEGANIVRVGTAIYGERKY